MCADLREWREGGGGGGRHGGHGAACTETCSGELENHVTSKLPLTQDLIQI